MHPNTNRTRVEDAAVAALVHLSPGLVTVDAHGSVRPFGLFSRTFDDPLVGLEDGQMPAFFAAVSTTLGSARVDALIKKNLIDQPTAAAATIADIVSLIQFWVEQPES